MQHHRRQVSGIAKHLVSVISRRLPAAGCSCTCATPDRPLVKAVVLDAGLVTSVSPVLVAVAVGSRLGVPAAALRRWAGGLFRRPRDRRPRRSRSTAASCRPRRRPGRRRCRGDPALGCCGPRRRRCSGGWPAGGRRRAAPHAELGSGGAGRLSPAPRAVGGGAAAAVQRRHVAVVMGLSEKPALWHIPACRQSMRSQTCLHSRLACCLSKCFEM